MNNVSNMRPNKTRACFKPLTYSHCVDKCDISSCLYGLLLQVHGVKLSFWLRSYCKFGSM